MLRKIVLAAALVFSALGVSSAYALSADRLDFTVLRNDEVVGKHSIVFTRKDEETQVDIETNVAVKLLFVTVYRFEHKDREMWRDGQLVQLESQTNDDGDAKSLSVRLNGDGLEVEGSANTFLADPQIIPASLWNRAVVTQSSLLNTLDGSEMKINVDVIGDESIEVFGKPTNAKHYVLTGELERDLWFDDDDTLVQMALKGSDGSDVLYVLK